MMACFPSILRIEGVLCQFIVAEGLAHIAKYCVNDTHFLKIGRMCCSNS